MTSLQEKKKLLKVKKEEVEQLEEEIAKCSLEDQTSQTPSLSERFPIGSALRLIGKNEKYRLRLKRAVVVGHTTCCINLEKKKTASSVPPKTSK